MLGLKVLHSGSVKFAVPTRKRNAKRTFCACVPIGHDALAVALEHESAKVLRTIGYWKHFDSMQLVFTLFIQIKMVFLR